MVAEPGLTPKPKFSATVLYNDLHHQTKPAPLTLEPTEMPSSRNAHFTDGETKALKAKLSSTARREQQRSWKEHVPESFSPEVAPCPSTEEGPTLGHQVTMPWLPWWRPVGISGPAEGASTKQSSNSRTELQGTHPVLWILEKHRAEKAGWDRRRRGSPGPCQEPLHHICSPLGAGGKGETVWFPPLRQLRPRSHQQEVKDETSSLPRRGDEAVTGS